MVHGSCGTSDNSSYMLDSRSSKNYPRALVKEIYEHNIEATKMSFICYYRFVRAHTHRKAENIRLTDK